MMRVATIVLAAGESSRLGFPKQLLEFEGKTLLRRAIETAIAADIGSVFVVLGSEPTSFMPEIPAAATVIMNHEAREGMSSSIRAAVSAMTNEIDALIFLVCDQPMLTAEILIELARHAGEGIAAAEYDGSIGVPALFSRAFFPGLLLLRGDHG